MKSQAAVVMLTASALISVHCVTASPAKAATLYVDSGDTVNIQKPYTFPGIQAAVDSADPGDTVVVPDGTYTENVVIDKPLTVRSENGAASTTIVAANADEDVFRIEAEHVTLSGLTVYGATGTGKAGILLSSGASSCIISDNTCGGGSSHRNYFGIRLLRTTGNTISHNRCRYNSHYGINALQSSGNAFRDNACSSNGRTGIHLDRSDDSLMESNDCMDNAQTGIYLDNSNTNVAIGNNCTGGEYGIRLNGSDDNPVNGNRLIENFCYNNSTNGVYVQDSIDNIVINNTILNSGRFGIRIDRSSSNDLWLNNLLDSGDRHVSSNSSTSRWISSLPLWYTYDGTPQINFLGNHYDDHDLSDADGDGVADAAYTIEGGGGDDGYPLARQSYRSNWGWDIVSDGDETIAACAGRTVASSLTISTGLVSITGGRLTIGGLW